MELRDHVRKVFGVGVHREVDPLSTLERVRPFLRAVGITRMADITGLDRIGIPVWTAVVPRSADVVSVYNGKGLGEEDARAGAVMEAIERHAAAAPRRPAAVGSYVALSGARPTLRPAEVNLELQHGYTDETETFWVEGYDLLNSENVLVPLFLAGYYVMGFPGPTVFTVATTNGLASGNSLEEAVCHALCEVIERDAWTLADLIGHRFSRALAGGVLGEGVAGPGAAAWFRDRYPNIDPVDLPEAALSLLARFHEAGLRPALKNITSDIGIASILCSVTEAGDAGASRAHIGVGTHPDAGVAVVRALTEAAQSRAVDIQGLREDVSLPDATVDKSRLHVKRSSVVDPRAWYHVPSSRPTRFAQLPSHAHGDVMDDVRLMVRRLRDSGLQHAIAVDLSPPEVPASVVRVIVPGLESWAIDRGRLGRRAAAAWAAAVSAARAPALLGDEGASGR